MKSELQPSGYSRPIVEVWAVWKLDRVALFNLVLCDGSSQLIDCPVKGRLDGMVMGRRLARDLGAEFSYGGFRGDELQRWYRGRAALMLVSLEVIKHERYLTNGEYFYALNDAEIALDKEFRELLRTALETAERAR